MDGKKGNNSLQKEQIAFHELIDIMPGNVYWLDKNGTYLGCNQRHAEHAALNSPKEIIGKKNSDLPWKKDAVKIDSVNKKIMNSGKLEVIEEVNITPAGNKEVYHSEKIPLKNENDEVFGLLGVSFDITERKNLERALAGANSEKTEFISALNNTLRSQINTISLMAEMLRKSGTLTEKQDEYLTLLEEANDSMPADLTYAADYAKLESGELSVYETDSRPIHHIEQLFEMYYRRAANKGLVFFVDYGDLPKSVLHMPVEQFREIFTILFEQIIDYTEHGEIYVCCTRNKTAEGTELTIVIKDTGPGFAADFVPHLFSLSEAKKNSDVDYPLLSMKFAFCKKLVEALNGTIRAESTLGRGTRYYLTFMESNESEIETSEELQGHAREYILDNHFILIDDNRDRAEAMKHLFKKNSISHIVSEKAATNVKHNLNEAHPANMIFIEESALEKNPELLRKVREVINNETVLILILSDSNSVKIREWTQLYRNVVAFKKPIIWSSFYKELMGLWNRFNEHPLEVLSIEDDTMCQRGLELVLQDFDCNFIGVGSGEKALELLDKNYYQAIFLDIGLPGKSGLVIAKEIKDKLGEECPPLIALTGLTRKIDIDELHNSSLFMAVLEKPATVNQLETVIADVRNPPVDDDYA